MHLRDGIKSAFQSIFSHKLRSLLTVTGIVIGVLAVVTMFSSIYALKALISKNMEGMGWNLSLIIFPGTDDTDDATTRNRDGIRRAKQSVPSLNYDDYLAIKSTLKYKSIYAQIESSSLFRLGNKTSSVRLRATDAEFFRNKSYPIGQGRMFNSYEDENAASVAILGYYFAQERFKQKNPIGQTLTLGQHRFTIIGVLADDVLSSGNGMNFNNWERKEDLKAVYVPLKYGVNYFGTGGMVHQIYLQAASEADYGTLKKEVRQLLLARHNMFPNFQFMDIGDLMISIQERMAEIGIRKSIGASEHDIFFYFIFEALALAFIGASFGVLLAWLIITAIAKGINFPLYLPIQGVAVGLGFSMLIGFLSGLYPAWKAAGIDPIQAIYYRE
jgi:putative ABC transport system permease protein